MRSEKMLLNCCLIYIHFAYWYMFTTTGRQHSCTNCIWNWISGCVLLGWTVSTTTDLGWFNDMVGVAQKNTFPTVWNTLTPGNSPYASYNHAA